MSITLKKDSGTGNGWWIICENNDTRQNMAVTHEELEELWEAVDTTLDEEGLRELKTSNMPNGGAHTC